MLFSVWILNKLSLRSFLSNATVSSSAITALTSKPNPSVILTKPQLEALVRNHFKGGKFFSLLQNVVASPSVLLTACRNLAARPSAHGGDPDSSSVSNWLDLEHLSCQLTRNEFDPVSCCVTLRSSSQNYRKDTGGGESLVLPNLKLKVVIEAIRMVLEVVYDDGFKTFVYGGRIGMGRHTAIRYLKNSIENPSWWFTVVFNRSLFDSRHVSRLCSVMREKIDDALLIRLIERLFESEAVRIELGAFYLGRGLPQESGLCSILLNVYLDEFDRSVQKIRLRMNQENEKIKIEENGYEDEGNLFYKPVKVYAVRYLDEMLMITSGSKKLTIDFKNWVCKYLEQKLELNVDRARTVIHSTVSEKIEFLGMELQAVPPSILNPPMSEKAKRALKKHLRQKEVQALELRNARERNRKMLGLKIFNHVFKKLKQSDVIKFDYQIENAVKEIFRKWSDEVVQQYLMSVEDRWEWHRHLTAGDFLSLHRIRKQLPMELVDAYDKFQEQVDRHLNPSKAKKAMEEETRRVEEEEERKYSERTVKDLTKLSMKIAAPIELVRKAVQLAGFTNKMGRPRPISLLNALEDADIIKWYAGVGTRWLDYFCCCHNFKMVKTIVTYHLRFSCILTLAEKHDSTKQETIRHYSKDLKLTEEIYFPTEREVKKMGAMNLSDPKPVDGAITLSLIRLASDEPSYTCSAHFCGRNDTTVYRVHLSQNRLNVNVEGEEEWVKGMASIHEAMNRKCLPLCPDHASELHMARICLQDVDCAACLDLE